MEKLNNSYQQQMRFVLILLALVTLIELVNLLSGRILNQWGTIPRQVSGLSGIVLSPWLHGSLLHYFSNIIPLGIFTFLTIQYGFKRYVWISLWLMVSTGLAVWLFARDARHIGASGMIYGYFAFLLVAGFINGRVKMIIISVAIGLFYGGMIFGVLPTLSYISWESHLFGFIAGLVAAKLWAKRIK